MRFWGTAVLFCRLAVAINLHVHSSGGNKTSELQYGIMFEEIDHAGDGGLYAELIQNRAFQADSPSAAKLAPWTPVNGAELSLTTDNPLSSALPVSVNVARPHSGVTPIGLSNPGYFGIAVLPQTYTGSFWVFGNYDGDFTASLSSLQTGEVFASTTFLSQSSDGQWTQHSFTLQPTVRASDAFNQFSLSFDANRGGPLQFNLVSLFPPTWKNRENGLRADLAEPLEALKPSFLRFPGGSNLLGLGAPSHWRWQDTIGPLKNRPGYAGAWQYENTNGLGLAEFLNWCEDLDMTPILALWAGQYIRGPPDTDIDSQIQDALDELEYVMGSTDTKYGALRSSHGRTEPWRLGYVEVGNEDWGSTYADRWPQWYNAITQKWPNLNVMSSSVYISLANQPNSTQDFHLYSRPDNLVAGFNHFDHNKSDHKILVGELADLQYNNGNASASADFQQPHITQPFWAGTVAETIFMLGLERNTDKILGATYFSILENFVASQWSPGFVRFNADPANTILTTTYQAFKLLSTTRYEETLPVDHSAGDFGPAYWVAGKGGQHQRVLKAAVYNSTSPVSFKVRFDGVQPGSKANLTVLTASDPFAAVSISQNSVVSTTQQLHCGRESFSFTLPDRSIALLTV